MFDPIPELRQIEGDITLYFLSSNFVLFSRKMDDPWYSAHTDFMEVFMTGLDGRMTTYRGDEPASVLACVSQYQFCNPNQPVNSQCTALGSIEDREQEFKSLHFNDRQEKVIEWFGSLLAYSMYTLKIVTTAYTNFNTFGLCLTFAVGTLIIVVSYTIEPVVSWIQKRRTLDTYSRLEWCANETLQLQRMAHEELGVGTWHNGAEAIPLTDGGERLATLDVTNPDHPRLKAPPVHFDALLARGNEGKARLSSKDAGRSTVSSEKPDPANHVGEVAGDCPGNNVKWPLLSDGVPSVGEREIVERHSGTSNVQSGLS
ncbi:hypothetical protein SLS58_007142 [Diplodia intermedia]|uniref:Uncharacterized protein n=1 Tax=Diplodia intermedia TaxID=856260 RepID=A0ABR3TKU2_9PEZI